MTKKKDDEDALELPDREALSLLETLPTATPLPSAEGYLAPGTTTGAAPEGGVTTTATSMTEDATELATAEGSVTRQGSTTTEDRSEVFSATDSARAES